MEEVEMNTRLAAIAVPAVLLSLPTLGFAQATSSGAAVRSAHIGQEHAVFIDDGTNNQKWFRYELRAGRSYCVEAGAGESQSSDIDATDDTIVTVYQSDATTVIASQDDTVAEPDSFRGSRVCFIAPGTTTFVRLTDFAGGTYTYRMRLVETTLFASWFFIGGDYNAFSLLRNTTTTTINYTMTWRNSAGTVVATTSGTVPPNGGIGINARTFVNAAVTINGTVEIVHTASPEGLVGQVTSLSSTTGLGFDSTIFQRKAW
jgi:hypothetical protein